MKYKRRSKEKVERIKLCSSFIAYAKFKANNMKKISTAILNQMEFLAKQLKQELECYKAKDGYKICYSCGAELPDTSEYFSSFISKEYYQEGDEIVLNPIRKTSLYCLKCKGAYDRIARKHRSSSNLYTNGLSDHILGNYKFIKETKDMERKREKSYNDLLKLINRIKVFAKSIEGINNKIMERIYLEEQEKEAYSNAQYKNEDSYFIMEEEDEDY